MYPVCHNGLRTDKPEDMPKVNIPDTVFVNVYKTDRAYGGPEEGGWWYDTGELLISIPCRNIKSDIDGFKAWAEKEYAHEACNLPKWSVNHRGTLEIVVESRPGESYPQSRPYYS